MHTATLRALKNVTKQLEEEKPSYGDFLLEQIVDSLPVGVWFVNKENYCYYVNETYRLMASVRLEETLGYNWFNVVDSNFINKLQNGWAEYIATPMDSPYIYVFKFKKNPNLMITTAGPLWSRGEVVGYIGAVSEIPEAEYVREYLISPKGNN